MAYNRKQLAQFIWILLALALVLVAVSASAMAMAVGMATKPWCGWLTLGVIATALLAIVIGVIRAIARHNDDDS